MDVPADQVARCFKIYGFGGLKHLWIVKKGQVVPRIRVPLLSSLLIDMSEIFVMFCRPSLGLQLFFVKDLDDKGG